MKKKSLLLFLSGAMILSGFNTISAESFDGREAEMNQKCAVIYDAKTQAECARYKEYLKNKSDSFDNEISNIQKEIAAAQGNIDKVSELMKKNDDELVGYEAQIADIQGIIDTTQASIDELQATIEKKTEDIKKRDAYMKKQMKSSQASLGMNGYVDFVMGSSSFIDLIRRSQALGELQRYEKKEIETLVNEKKALHNDKKIIEEHKSLLEVQRTDIDLKKQKVVALKDANSTLLSQYRLQEASLFEQKRTAQMAQASIPKIDLSLAEEFDKEEPVTPQPPTQPDSGTDTGGESGGSEDAGGNTPSQPTPDPTPTPTPTPPAGSTSFISPLQYGWHYESGTWQYPTGGGHMGMDFSTGYQMGIPVVAPGDGIIIYTYNGGCNNKGESSCGIPWGGGNNTLLLTKKGNTIYAMPFYHLTSATRSAGTRVNQGDVIGYSGNSGNSFGAHCHVEVIQVGNMSMADALNIYNRTGDVTFGTGWNADSPKACGTAPCREKPENYWL